MINERQTSRELKQRPLGELLYDARKNKGWTRAQLAEFTKIGTSSIVRYEKAGVDADGQMPQLEKLVALCFHLDISVPEAFWSCLSPEEFSDVSDRLYHELRDHPSYRYLKNQHDVLLKENRFLREAAKCLLGANDEFPWDESDKEWLRSELKTVINRQEDFESRMLQWGLFELKITRYAEPGPDTTDAWALSAENAGQIESKNSLPNSRFAWSARQSLQKSIDNLDKVWPELRTMTREDVAKTYKKSPEDDLPSPPSPKIDEN